MVVALSQTIRLMAEIDEAIPDWPIQSGGDVCEGLCIMSF